MRLIAGVSSRERLAVGSHQRRVKSAPASPIRLLITDEFFCISSFVFLTECESRYPRYKHLLEFLYFNVPQLDQEDNRGPVYL